VSSGCWTSSIAASRIGSQRDPSDGRGPLRGVRHRTEAARTRQVEMVCSYERRTYRHVRLGMQSRRSQIQGGARAVSPAVRQCLTSSQVAAGAVRPCSAAPSPVQGYRNVIARCLGVTTRSAESGRTPSSRNPFKVRETPRRRKRALRQRKALMPSRRPSAASAPLQGALPPTAGHAIPALAVEVVSMEAFAARHCSNCFRLSTSSRNATNPSCVLLSQWAVEGRTRR
jgi:hypothetical protein